MSEPLDRIRQGAQALGAAIPNSYLAAFSSGQIYKGPLKCTCLPVLSCHSCPSAIFSCPIGTVQHYAVLHKVPLFLFGLFGIVGLLVGRMACGWLCPFGLVQDLLNRVRSTKIQLPSELSITRYAVALLLVFLLPYATGQTWFSILCPLGTLSAAIPWAVWNPVDPLTAQPVVQADAVGALFAIKIGILIGFMLSFVVAKRPFCRLFCPLGLFFSLFNRVSLVQLEVSEECNRCDRCQEVCPVDIKVYDAPNSGECIRCLRCTGCPQVKVTSRLLPGGMAVDGVGK
jgi:polyferredoxin